MTQQTIALIEELYISNIRITGPQLVGFIFDNYDNKIIKIDNFINKEISKNDLLRYDFMTHFCIRNILENLDLFTAFTKSKNTNINGCLFNNIPLNHQILRNANPIGYGYNDILKNYFIFYDIYEYYPKLIRLNLDIKKESIEIFNKLLNNNQFIKFKEENNELKIELMKNLNELNFLEKSKKIVV